MPLGWVSAGIAAVGVIEGASSSHKARQQASRQMALEERALKMDEQKFAEQQVYAGQLFDLITRPESMKDMPGYQFQFEQGAEAVRRKMDATGFAGSGNEAIALTQYGQGFAQNFYQQQANLLASLSGLQTAQTPNAGQFGQIGANYSQQSTDAMSRALSSLGYFAGQYGSYSNRQEPLLTGTPYYDQSGYGYNMPSVPGG